MGISARPAGTLLVDLEAHRPVDVLLGSDEDVLAEWLLSHPGVQIISRDRGAGYLKGARKGAPRAQQVLDRWHVLKNLREVLQKALAERMETLRQAALEARAFSSPAELVPPSGSSASALPPRKPPRRKPAPPRPQRAWQLKMFEQVHQLAAEGKTQQEMVRLLHLNRQTVRKYLCTQHLVDRRQSPHASCVEPYRAYLEKRWAQGPTMIRTLWQELCLQGFTGSYKSVWLFTQSWPLPPGATPTPSSLPSSSSVVLAQSPRTPRQATWLLLRPPEELCEKDRLYRETLCRLSPEIANASRLAQGFVQMVRQRKSEALDPWLEQASSSVIQPLRRFALGLRQEYSAMRAALQEPWSTAEVEGQITRLKYLKRQMYGRAKIDLLRLCVLHPT